MNKIMLIGTTAQSVYTFRSELIKSFIKRNYHVYALISEYSSKDEFDKIYELGATPIIYHLNRSSINPFTNLIAVIQLVKIIQNIKPDLVFSYFSKPVIFGTLAAKIANVPTIIGMLEGLGYSFTEQPTGLTIKTKLIKSIQILLYHISLPKLTKLIFLNPDDPNDLLNRYRIKVKEIEILGGIGLNLDQYNYQQITTPLQPIRFLFIGRLLKEKGIYELIEATKIVQAKYPKTIFTVLGSIDHANLGALSQKELDQCIQSNLIEYVGQVPNVQDWIRQSHVFVLPSYREGVPRSTQEAMAMGRPVITTDVPGCRETVINGVNGFLVPKWNSQALAEKMIFFIENPEQIKIMGDASHQLAVEKFDAQKVNERLCKMLGL